MEDALGQQVAPAGSLIVHGAVIFGQADYIMSRDGFANPALCMRVCACVRRVTDDVAQLRANQTVSWNLVYSIT